MFSDFQWSGYVIQSAVHRHLSQPFKPLTRKKLGSEFLEFRQAWIQIPTIFCFCFQLASKFLFMLSACIQILVQLWFPHKENTSRFISRVVRGSDSTPPLFENSPSMVLPKSSLRPTIKVLRVHSRMPHCWSPNGFRSNSCVRGTLFTHRRAIPSAAHTAAAQSARWGHWQHVVRSPVADCLVIAVAGSAWTWAPFVSIFFVVCHVRIVGGVGKDAASQVERSIDFHSSGSRRRTW